MLALYAPNPQNGQMHSNNLSTVVDELFECVWPFCGVGAWRVSFCWPTTIAWPTTMANKTCKGPSRDSENCKGTNKNKILLFFYYENLMLQKLNTMPIFLLSAKEKSLAITII